MADPISCDTSRPREFTAPSEAIELKPVIIAGDAVASPTPSQVLDLDPVIITGEVGARELARQHRQNTRLDPAACSRESVVADTECNGALWAAVGAGLAAVNPIFLVVGVGVTFNEGFKCGQARAQYDECLELRASREQAVEDCEAVGGTALQGAEETELVCLVQR